MCVNKLVSQINECLSRNNYCAQKLYFLLISKHLKSGKNSYIVYNKTFLTMKVTLVIVKQIFIL